MQKCEVFLYSFLNLFKLAIKSKVQVAKKEFIITEIDLYLVLNALLILLEGFFMNLQKVAYPLFDLALMCGKMSTYKSY